MHPALVYLIQRAVTARVGASPRGFFQVDSAIGKLAVHVTVDGSKSNARFMLDGKAIRQDMLDSTLKKFSKIRG